MPPRGTQDDDLTVELRRYALLILHKWYWVVIGLILGGLAGWLYLRYTPDVYQAQSTFYLGGDDGSRGISQQMVIQEIGYVQENNISDDLQRLGSTHLFRRVVDSLQLNIVLKQIGRILDTERYGDDQPLQLQLTDSSNIDRLYGSKLSLHIAPENGYFTLVRAENDSLRLKFGETFSHRGVELAINRTEVGGLSEFYEFSILEPEQVARRYSERVSINSIGQSKVVRLILEDEVPRKAVDILSTLMAVYQASVLEDKSISGKQTLDFIDERLDFVSRELYQVEGAVENFRRTNDLAVDITERASEYLAAVNDADNRIAEINLEIDFLNSMASFLQDQENRYSTLPIGSVALQGSIAELVNTYNGVIYMRNQRMESATAINPAVATFEEQLTQLRETILKNVKIRITELQVRKEQIQERLAPLEQRLDAVPSNQRALVEIMRQQQIKENLTLFLMEKREETALNIAAQTATSQVLDNAYSYGPISPKSGQIYAFTILIGLILPIGGILFFDIFNNKVRGRKDVEEYTSAPFLGSIGYTKDQNSVIVKSGNRTSTAEMFRLLRTNLQFMREGQGPRTILLTSSISGEGKSFVTINLGASLALAGQKVLLMGFDLRKPKMSLSLTGQQAGSGLTNYLVGEMELNEVIRTWDEGPTMDYIPCGIIPPNPSEIILNSRMKALFKECQERYDVILIDSPPVGLVTDALILAEYASQSIMVTRANITRLHHLKLIEETYRERRLPRLGVVLNGVKKGDSYGYGYGYGYGYYDE